jgi:xanthine dehydrogenase accessory factor
MNSPQEFERLHAAVRVLAESGFTQPAALATITRTAGSTFRRAGASMLIRADGDVVCALSGGCPQRDIAARAAVTIASGQAQIARYNRDSALDVLMEMGCGGELDVLIEPLANAADVCFLDAIAALRMRRGEGILATVFAIADTVVSRPRRMVIGDSIEWDDIGDAELRARVATLARTAAQSARALLHPIDSAQGTLQVLIEPLRPAHELTVIGINPAASALARVGAGLGWNIRMVDLALARGDVDLVPAGARIVLATPPELVAKANFDAHSSVVVMTFNIEHDIAWLRALTRTPVVYLGAIGSRERTARMRAAIDGASAQLHAPAGLDLGSETPEEIAIAVAAEILACLNAREGGRLSRMSIPIHA